MSLVCDIMLLHIKALSIIERSNKNMIEKRRDKKNRILHNGESQRLDGRYVYKYTDSFGKQQFVYAWKLVPTDKTPNGKRDDKSLREKEQEILKDLNDGIDTMGKKISVCKLYEKKNSQRPNVKEKTKKGRKRLMKFLEEDKIGICPIEKVKLSDAIALLIRMKEKGIAYQTIKNDKRSLYSAFELAIQDDYIRKNPFDFNIDDVIVNDTQPTIPLTLEQEESLYAFIKEDKTYSKYYDDVILLRETGVRISELCGLTNSDLDFENRLINIDHQLLKSIEQGYYIDDTKTDNSMRKIPMSDKAYEIFKRIVDNQKNTKTIVIDGYSGFLFLKKDGFPKTNQDYDNIFRGIKNKYNKCCELKLPNKLTPHVLRHTFCTNWANDGMNPRTLQYIMGHKNIEMTLKYYTHPTYSSARAEMERIIKQKQFYYQFTTFESENIKDYKKLCEYLLQLKMS